jgi:hypothetical protein
MTFRFNNSDNSFFISVTMMKLIESPLLEYKNLTAT